MNEPAERLRGELRWDESNPEWWRAQVEERREYAWPWLVNEWGAALAAERKATVERIRAAVGAIRWSQSVMDSVENPPRQQLLAILDAAARP